jgi:hypothetical protein
MRGTINKSTSWKIWAAFRPQWGTKSATSHVPGRKKNGRFTSADGVSRVEPTILRAPKRSAMGSCWKSWNLSPRKTAVRRQQDIRRFEVAVDNTVQMRVVHGVGQNLGQVGRFLKGGLVVPMFGMRAAVGSAVYDVPPFAGRDCLPGKPAGSEYLTCGLGRLNPAVRLTRPGSVTGQFPQMTWPFWRLPPSPDSPSRYSHCRRWR